MSIEIANPNNCRCGESPLSTRAFNGTSWQCRVQCASCGIVVGKGDDLPYAISLWNSLQPSQEPHEEGISVIASYRNDIRDYVVRVGTKKQIDNKLHLEFGATCYRADGVNLNDRTITEAAKRCGNISGFLTMMKECGGVTLELVQ